MRASEHRRNLPKVARAKRAKRARVQEPLILGTPVSRFALRTCILLLGAYSIGFVIPKAAVIFYLGSAIWCLLKPRRIVEGISFMFFILMANPGLLSGFKDLRWLVLACGFFSALGVAFGAEPGVWARLPKFFLVVLAFVCVELVVNRFSSKIPTISVFKLVSFGIGATTLILGFAIAKRQNSYWMDWFGGLFAAALIGSVFYRLVGRGYEYNGTGFQGVFGHPQTLGTLVGVMTAFFVGRYLFERSKGSLWLVFGVLGFVLVYMSGCRTGGFAMVLGGILVCGYGFIRRDHNFVRSRVANHAPTFALIGILSIFFAPSQFQKMLEEFATKGEGDYGGISQAFTQSRQSLIDRSMDNFRQYPIAGIGFGLPSEASGTSESLLKVQRIAGIPISASVEKGSLPAAMLEETGIIGAVLCLALLAAVVHSMVTRGNYILSWMALTAILLNVGEAMFFSMGGLGLFVWTVIAWMGTPVPSKLKN